jgi:hypothetical protein
MKQTNDFILIAIIAALLTVALYLLSGCSPYKCYPSKNSRDYARQLKDGSYLVTRKRFNTVTYERHECLPADFINDKQP